jgi:hypothetical protein
VFGAPAPPGELRLVLALWDLETDQGRKSFNHNWGNLVEKDPSRPHYVATDSGNIRRFQAFPSHADGAAELLRELERKDPWRAGLATAHPVEFARALKGPPAYYEAPVKRYSRALTARWLRYRHLGAGSVRQIRNGSLGILVTLGVICAIVQRRTWLAKTMNS